MAGRRKKTRRQVRPLAASKNDNAVLKGLAAIALAVVTGAAEGIAPRMLPPEEPKPKNVIVVRREENGRLTEFEIPWAIGSETTKASGLPPDKWEIRFRVSDPGGEERDEMLEMYTPSSVLADRVSRYLIPNYFGSSETTSEPPAASLVIPPAGGPPGVIVDFGKLDQFALNNTLDLAPNQIDLLRKVGKVHIVHSGTSEEATTPNPGAAPDNRASHGRRR